MNVRNNAIILSLLVVSAPQVSTQVIAQPVVNAPTVVTAPKTESEYEKSLAAAKNILEVQTWSGARSKERRNKSAAIEFEKAGDNAPDGSKKYEAYMKAGEYYEYARFDNSVAAASNRNDLDLQLRQSPFRAYEKATKVANLSGEQKGKAYVKMADAARIRDWVPLNYEVKVSDAEKRKVGDKIRAMYQVVLDTPGADKESRKHAQKYLGYVWQEQGEYLKAAQAMESLSNWPDLANHEQLDALNSAVYVLTNTQKAHSNPAVTEVLDRLYPRIVKLETKPEDVATKHMHWGDWLLAYGNAPRALVVWNTLADDNKISHEVRAQALQKIADYQIAQKQMPLALKVWERTASWPAPPVPPAAKTHTPYLNWAHRRAASRADIYLNQGDETKLRGELKSIVTIAQNNPDLLWHARYNLAASLLREIEKVRKANPNLSTQAKAQIAEKEKAASAELGMVVNTAEVGDATRYEAAVQRAQIELDNKRYVEARAWLVIASEKLKAKDQLFGPKNAYVLPLMKLAAKVAFAEKNYVAGVDALISGLNYRGQKDDEAVSMLFEIWGTARQEKQWDQARQILQRMKENQLPEAEYQTTFAVLETEAGDWKAAAGAVVLAEKLTLSEEQKKNLASAVAKIPADVLKKAREEYAAKNPVKPAPPATNNVGGGGFGWWF